MILLNKVCQSTEEHEQLKKDCALVATELCAYMTDFVWEIKPPSLTTNRYTVRSVVNDSLHKKAKILHQNNIIKLKQKKIGNGLFQLIVDSLDIEKLHIFYKRKSAEKKQPLKELAAKMIDIEMRLAKQEELNANREQACEELEEQVAKLRSEQTQANTLNSTQLTEILEAQVQQLKESMELKLAALEAKIDAQQALDKQFFNAVIQGEYDAVLDLLNNGANPHANNGLALRLTVQHDHLSIAKLLVASGLSCNALDAEKNSARSLAQKLNKTGFITLFNYQQTLFLKQLEAHLTRHKESISAQQNALLDKLKLLTSKVDSATFSSRAIAVRNSVLEKQLWELANKISSVENQVQLGQLDRSAIKSELEPLRIEHHLKQQKLHFQKKLLEKSAPSLSAFHARFKQKVGQLLLACYALQSGLISADDGMMGSLESAGEMLPIVGTFVALGVRAISYARSKQREKKMARAVDLIQSVNDIDRITEDLALSLSSRYRLQIELMTDRGAEVFAECCMNRLYYFLRSKDSYVDEQGDIASQLIQGVMLQKPIKITKKKGIRATKPIETKEPSLHGKWNEAGVLQKTGIVISNAAGHLEFYSRPEDKKQECQKQKQQKLDEKAALKAMAKFERKEQKKAEKQRKEAEGPEASKRVKKQTARLYTNAKKYGYTLGASLAELEAEGIREDIEPKGPMMPSQKEFDELTSTKKAKKEGVDTAIVNALKDKIKSEHNKFYSSSSLFMFWQRPSSSSNVTIAIPNRIGGYP